MTSTTREIFDRFLVRKTKAQKRAFIDWVKPLLEQKGYPVTLEKVSFGTGNIVIGDLEKAKLIFTAHYDTCAVLPFPNFITPKNPGIYWLYQIGICIPVFALIGAVTWLFRQIDPALTMVGYWFGFLAFLGIMTCGPANKNTYNDNTSGTTAVIDLALAMPRELREDVAFVLFDLEEAGLVGSSAFASKHKKVMKKKLLVNLDCVSDGETMLFVFNKKNRDRIPIFEQAYPAQIGMTPLFSPKHHIYPSDQANFPLGVGVAALLKSKKGILYMDKIHTPRDTVYREENITWLVEGSIRLTQAMAQRNGESV